MLELCAIAEMEIDWSSVGVIISDASGVPVVARARLQDDLERKFLN